MGSKPLYRGRDTAAAGFRRDQCGVSAVEFALILPLLIMLYLGGVELSHAITIDRKVTAATSAVGDLIAQADEIDSGELDNIFRAASAILAPYESVRLRMVVSSVEISKDGDEVTVLWSRGHHATAHAAGSSIPIPDGVNTPNTTLIITESEYNYVPVFGQIFTDSIRLSDTFYLRPRAVDRVLGPRN